LKRNHVKIVITGFCPFGGDKVNPTQVLVDAFNGKSFNNIQIFGRVIPCSFRRLGKVLKSLYEEIKPDIAINLGLKSGGKGINVERIAINMMNPPIPDNDGYFPQDVPINKKAEIAYFATLPIRKMVQNMRNKGIPAIISNNAGLFTCNCAMFHTLYLSKNYGVPAMGGFIHIPYFSRNVSNKLFNYRELIPSMTFEIQYRAIKIAVLTAAKEYKNILL